MTPDSQILLIRERLLNDLDRGESHFREFKSVYPKDANETVFVPRTRLRKT